MHYVFHISIIQCIFLLLSASLNVISYFRKFISGLYFWVTLLLIFFKTQKKAFLESKMFKYLFKLIQWKLKIFTKKIFYVSTNFIEIYFLCIWLLIEWLEMYSFIIRNTPQKSNRLAINYCSTVRKGNLYIYTLFIFIKKNFLRLAKE